VSTRQLSRLLERYKLEGEAGLEHRAKNRPSNNSKPAEIREKFNELLKGDYVGMGPTLVRDFIEEDHGIELSRETVRAWMTEEETWHPTAEKPTHRRCRPRRACHGELVQMDTSEHHWFGPDAPLVQLIAMIDDATQKVHLLFTDTDSTETNMECILGYIAAYGPQAPSTRTGRPTSTTPRPKSPPLVAGSRRRTRRRTRPR
jgi:hypothetical protein